LLEPQSTNLITYSEDFSQWSASGNAVVSGGFEISPDGNINASKFTFDGTTNSTVNKTISVTNGVPYTFSVWLKNDNLSDPTKVWIGLSTTTQGEYVTVTNVWKRFIITSTSNGTLEYPRVQTSEVGSIFAWGAQFEQQSYATSYIASEGSQTTRNQETCINATPEINSEEGVLYAEISALDNPTSQEVALSVSEGQSGVNRLLIRMKTNGAIGIVLRVANTTEATIDSGVLDQSANHKVAVKWKVNDIALWIDGVEVGTDNLANVFPVNTLNEVSFNQGNNSNQFFGNTKDVQVYTKALSDAELIKLTTI
jgi:hypothetical protein